MGLHRIMAMLFGILFLAVGVMGYMPNMITDGNLLLGIFEVDNMHNMIHIGSGIIALLCCLQTSSSKWYFRIFGIVYGVVAIMGFVNAGTIMMMHMNMADNVLHTGIALISLWLGFLKR